MNVADTHAKVDKSKDLLVQMFEKQTDVEKEFGVVEGVPERLLFGKLEHISSPETCKYLHEILWRMTCEIHELAVATKNAKTWRQSKYLLDANEMLDEVADVSIYLMNFCLAAGITPEKLTEIVLKKIEVNRQRIKTKY